MATKYLPKKELRSAICQLSPTQKKLAQEIYNSVGHLLSPTFERWERQFTSDLFPDRPLLTWGKLSKAFENYRAHHADVTDPAMLQRVLLTLAFEFMERDVTD